MEPQHIKTIASVLQHPIVRRAPTGDTMKRGPAYPPPYFSHEECVASAKKYLNLSEDAAAQLVNSLETKYTVTRWSYLLQRNIQEILSHRVMAEILNLQIEREMAA
jgi:hypothetical protein